MATPKDKHNRNADALEALAAGELSSADSNSEGEAPIGPSSGLMLLSEGEQEPPADDFLHEMAAEEQDADANADLGDLAPAEPGEEGLLDDVAFASKSAAPVAQRTAKLQTNMRRVHTHAYKRTMIPLLLVVGLLLIALSVLTLFLLIGQRNDPESLADGMTYLQAYGKYFILAALPMGAILLAGAWMFYLDVRKSSGTRR